MRIYKKKGSELIKWFFFFVIVKKFGKGGQKEKLEINEIILEDSKINW